MWRRFGTDLDIIGDANREPNISKGNTKMTKWQPNGSQRVPKGGQSGAGRAPKEDKSLPNTHFAEQERQSKGEGYGEAWTLARKGC